MLARLTSVPFVLERPDKQAKRVNGIKALINWLADQPGRTWQERWLSSGADAADAAWREVSTRWLCANGHKTPWRHEALAEALPVAISADVLRPSLCWLVGGGLANGGLLVRNLAASRDPEGFTRLATACDDDPRVSPSARSQTIYRAALIVAAKGGMLNDIVVGDVVELLDAQIERRISPPSERMLLYRLLYQLGIFAPGAPATLRALRTAGQRSPEELIDRYHLNCRPVRDLLVDYLARTPACFGLLQLGGALHLLGQTVLGRSRASPSRHRQPAPEHRGLGCLETAPSDHQKDGHRRGGREGPGGGRADQLPGVPHTSACLLSRPGPLGCRGSGALGHLGDPMSHRRGRDQPQEVQTTPQIAYGRPHPGAPAGPSRRRPQCSRSANHSRGTPGGGSTSPPGEALSAPGTELVRSVVDPRSGLGKLWVHDSVEGADRRDLARDEDHAFWAWAAVEVLRAPAFGSKSYSRSVTTRWCNTACPTLAR